MAHGTNPALAERAWRSARRLFGCRADDYEVSADYPALLIAKALREDRGLTEMDVVIVACDVIPTADSGTVLEMFRGEGGYPRAPDSVEVATGEPL